MKDSVLSSDFDEDIAKYKKKSRRPSIRKSNHKHNYQPCVFESEKIILDKTRGFVNSGEHEFSMGEYCPICGKIRSTGRKWFTYVPISPGSHILCLEPTEEAKKELNPYTRTIPTFSLKDRFTQKYVDLNECNP